MKKRVIKTRESRKHNIKYINEFWLHLKTCTSSLSKYGIFFSKWPKKIPNTKIWSGEYCSGNVVLNVKLLVVDDKEFNELTVDVVDDPDAISIRSVNIKLAKNIKDMTNMSRLNCNASLDELRMMFGGNVIPEKDIIVQDAIELVRRGDLENATDVIEDMAKGIFIDKTVTYSWNDLFVIIPI